MTTFECRVLRVSDRKMIDSVSRRRIDAARLAAKKLAYEYLGYDGMRDRPCAHAAMEWLDGWNTCEPKGEQHISPSYIMQLRAIY
jgi:hypothetical protein